MRLRLHPNPLELERRGQDADTRMIFCASHTLLVFNLTLTGQPFPTQAALQEADNSSPSR